MRMFQAMVAALLLAMIACILGAAIVSSCTPAKAAPLPLGSTVKAVKAAKPCKDPIIQVIRTAGWKGKQQRIAYAVAWRESNHQPGESTPPDLGLYQLNGPAWQGTKYWPADPLDAYSNAKAAHRLWRDYSWRPWGLNASGTGVDMRDYSWSAWQIEHWVWRPYVAGLHLYDRLPRACRV